MRPVKVYKAGRVEVAIFHNPQFDSYSFKFQKSYKDKNGQWQNTDFFSDTDMGDLGALVDQVREKRVKQKPVGGGQQDDKPTAQPPQQDQAVANTKKVFSDQQDGQEEIPF